MLITDWYIDAGLSGMDMSKRVELQRLISDVSKISNIVVYKLDRLARDSVDALYMIEKLFTPKGVRVNSVHDFARYETPQDKFQTHIMAAVAEYDRNTMLLRMRGGMLERVKMVTGWVVAIRHTVTDTTRTLVILYRFLNVLNRLTGLWICL